MPRTKASSAREDGPATVRSIVVIGASAGGIEALRTLAGGLPGDLPAAVFVVLHIGATSLSVLPSILSRAGSLPAAGAVEGEPIRNGRIYVAPPDHHLLLREEHVHVMRGPKEHRFRPAIDPLFRSAADAYGNRVIGVILSGTLGDGAMGLRAVKVAGGLAVVQDPQDALFASMPQRALETVDADHCVPVAEIGALLSRLCREPVPQVAVAPRSDVWTPSLLSCPDCGGSLSQAPEAHGLRFRCHVGHGFDGHSLLQAQDDTVENALHMAARALAEKASLLRQLGARARAGARLDMSDRWDAEAALYDERRDAVLQFFASGGQQDSLRRVGRDAKKGPLQRLTAAKV